MNWQPLLSIGLTYDEVLVIDPMPPFTREEYGENVRNGGKSYSQVVHGMKKRE